MSNELARSNDITLTTDTLNIIFIDKRGSNTEMAKLLCSKNLTFKGIDMDGGRYYSVTFKKGKEFTIAHKILTLIGKNPTTTVFYDGVDVINVSGLIKTLACYAKSVQSKSANYCQHKYVDRIGHTNKIDLQISVTTLGLSVDTGENRPIKKGKIRHTYFPCKNAFWEFNRMQNDDRDLDQAYLDQTENLTCKACPNFKDEIKYKTF